MIKGSIQNKHNFVRQMAAKMVQGQVISNSQVVAGFLKQYPAYTTQNSPIEAADYAPNTTSGYPNPKANEFTVHPCPVFFKTGPNLYQKYDASIHGCWICVLDSSGKKRVLKAH